jgi:hypothetical protein
MLLLKVPPRGTFVCCTILLRQLLSRCFSTQQFYSNRVPRIMCDALIYFLTFLILVMSQASHFPPNIPPSHLGHLLIGISNLGFAVSDTNREGAGRGEAGRVRGCAAHSSHAQCAQAAPKPYSVRP